MNADHSPQSIAENPLSLAAYVGLDWADKEHVLSLAAEGSRAIKRRRLEQTPEALHAWASELRSQFPGGRIAVCVEQSRGPLIHALMAYEHLVLYPVNPKS